MKAKGIPLDAPLFEGDPDRGAEFWNCECVQAYFTLKGSVSEVLPEGLEPAGDPALGAVVVADYGRSVFGPYREAVSMIQVKTADGEIGFYVPYIFVSNDGSNDAVLAGGREGSGFPKKFAKIEITRWSDIVQGTVERPAGTRLLTLTMQPNDRLDPSLEPMFGRVTTNIYTMRYAPGYEGRGELTQLIKSEWAVYPHADARGREIIFTGRTSVTYDARSVIDPIHKLEVGEMFAGVYLEYDAVLKPISVMRESFTPFREATLVG